MGISTFVASSESALEREMRGLGLQTRHAYGVLDAKVWGEEHLVKMRNPNGVALWKGPWGAHDAGNWTRAARTALGFDHEDRGVFWMRVADVAAYFVELTVCRLLPEHLEARCYGWLPSATRGRARDERLRMWSTRVFFSLSHRSTECN